MFYCSLFIVFIIMNARMPFFGYHHENIQKQPLKASAQPTILEAWAWNNQLKYTSSLYDHTKTED